MAWKDAQINKTVQSIVGLENLPKDSKNRDAIERISSQLVDKAEKQMQGKNGGGSGGTGAATNAAGAVASLARSASKMAGAVVPDAVKLKAPFGISEERKEEIRHRRATMDRYLPWNERNICCGSVLPCLPCAPCKVHVRSPCCPPPCGCKCPYSTVGCEQPACVPESCRCCHCTCGCFPICCFPLAKVLCCASWELIDEMENVPESLATAKKEFVNIGSVRVRDTASAPSTQEMD